MYELRPRRHYPPAWRVVLGFLLAPGVAAFTMAASSPGYEGLPDFSERVWRTAEVFALAGAYPTALFVGVPAYFVLRSRFQATSINCALAGAGIAAFPWVLFGLLPSIMGGLSQLFAAAAGILQIAVFGLIGGLTFWLLVVVGWRPANVS